MSVVMFHYTARYQVLFGHSHPLPLQVPWGSYGVDLFFMISGFVIFLTLDKISSPLDFVVSRFSRLYPTYWAAILVTFVLTHLFAVPGRTVGITTAILNLTMIQELIHVPDVDGVYWTLEVELIFYGLALTLFATGNAKRVGVAIAGLVGLRVVSLALEQYSSFRMSWTVNQLLILPEIAWFGLGILVYRQVSSAKASPRNNIVVGALCVAGIGIADGPVLAAFAAALSALLWAAASHRLPWLNMRLLVWLGTISYPLYLLHQNIGYGLILRIEGAGMAPELAVAMALAVSLALAAALSRLVERPAMAWIRAAYHRRHATSA